MQKFKIFVLLLFTILNISACSSQYWGYSKNDWNALTTQEQDAAKEKFQTILDLKNSEIESKKYNAVKETIVERGRRVDPGLRRHK